MALKTLGAWALGGFACAAMASSPSLPSKPAADGPVACDQALTTLEINRCAALNLQRAEAQQARYLAASLKRHVDDAALMGAIQTAQQDWARYRDSHCGAVHALWRDGSVRGAQLLACKTQLTEQRTQVLWRDFLTSMDNTPPVLPEPGPAGQRR